MNFLRLFFVLSLIIFCLASCAPDQNKAASSGEGERADAASFKALIGPKWCLPQTGGQAGFILSWNFREDGAAFFAKTKADTRQIVFNQKKKWVMRAKTLKISEESSGVELLKKELSFVMDLTTGLRAMTWVDPVKPADCDANGNCSSTSIQATTLTECE